MAKWLKYFSTSDIETYVKKDAKLYDSSNNCIGLITAGTKVCVKHQDEYDSQYCIEYENDNVKIRSFVSGRVIAKPYISGPSEQLSIQTSRMIDLGKPSTFKWHGIEISVRKFTSYEQLKKSIFNELEYIDVHYLTQQSMIEAFEQLDKFVWPNLTPLHHRNELGKYFGELLYSMRALKEQSCAAVLYPTQHNLPGVDCFIVNPKNNVIPVSNKYGSGAPSSLIPIINSAAQYNSSPSLLNSISDNISTLNSNKLGLIYTAMQMLEFKSIFPSTVIEMNKHRKNYDMFELTYDSIEKRVRTKYPLLWSKYLKSAIWPDSLPCVSSHIVAHELSRCPESMAALKHELVQQQGIQVKLNKKKWLDGCIDFDVKDFTDCQMIIIPSKSNINDYVCRNGLLSYRLRHGAN